MIVKSQLALELQTSLLSPNADFPVDSMPASSVSRAAIRRCHNAWKRAFIAGLSTDGDDRPELRDAVAQAAIAYRAAMPALDSLQNVRDFIACTAHGILIAAIPNECSGQLLYAAQVALSLLRPQAKKSAKPKKSVPTSSPSKERLPKPELMAS